MTRAFPLVLALAWAWIGCPEPALEPARRAPPGRSPLHRAAASGDLETLGRLLSEGGRVNARDKEEWTPLHLAAIADELEAAKLLIDRGADIDARGRYDMTPLHWASLRGSAHVAEELIARGAKLEARNIYGMTPLHEASTRAVARLLLSRGANLDAVDDRGMTPLHLARAEEVAKTLIDGGANILAESKAGKAPIKMVAAARDEPPEVVMYPEHGSLRMRGEEAQLGLRMRNLSETAIKGLALRAESPGVEASIEPETMARLNPAQMMSFTLKARRKPNVPPGEGSISIRITHGGDVALLGFNLRLNTLRELTPEDRGLIPLGKVKARPKPGMAQVLAYLSAPLLLLLGWLVLRKRAPRS